VKRILAVLAVLMTFGASNAWAQDNQQAKSTLKFSLATSIGMPQFVMFFDPKNPIGASFVSLHESFFKTVGRSGKVERRILTVGIGLGLTSDTKRVGRTDMLLMLYPVSTAINFDNGELNWNWGLVKNLGTGSFGYTIGFSFIF